MSKLSVKAIVAGRTKGIGRTTNHISSRTSCFWTREILQTTTSTKSILVEYSIKVRKQMFALFKKKFRPNKKTKVLDVGVTSLNIYPDSNLFEVLYPHPHNLVAATIESKPAIEKLFPKLQVKKIFPYKKLPFGDKEFDIAVSWATLEHVGNYRDQEFFLNELLRVSRHIFVTTPYRGCIYEPHTGFFFFHWLPLWLFRKCCIFFGKKAWSSDLQLNPLFVKDLKKFNLPRKINIEIFRMFNFVPSHLIITA